MPIAYAQFTGMIREDTRLYFASGTYNKGSGGCLGIVWLCNPGSATGSSSWAACASDQTLDVIADIFVEADRIARASGKRGAAADDYLQILNLHYVCDPDPIRGWNTFLTLSPQHFEQPCKSARFCWLAWGDVPQALLLQAAPIVSARTDCFFYDSATKTILANLKQLDFPMPPYGALRCRRYHPNYVDLIPQHLATKLP